MTFTRNRESAWSLPFLICLYRSRPFSNFACTESPRRLPTCLFSCANCTTEWLCMVRPRACNPGQNRRFSPRVASASFLKRIDRINEKPFFLPSRLFQGLYLARMLRTRLWRFVLCRITVKGELSAYHILLPNESIVITMVLESINHPMHHPVDSLTME